MKTIIFTIISALSVSFASFGQYGRAVITCMNEKELIPISDLTVEIWQDSVCAELKTDAHGVVNFEKLRPGQAEVRFILNSQKDEKVVIFIQENQVYQYTALLNFAEEELVNLTGKDYQLSPQGHQNGQVEEEDINSIIMSSSIFGASSSYLAEVEIVSYQTPLIDKDGGASGQTITRQDVTKMPVRSANGVASTVGGVYLEEGTENLNVRGGRRDANIYFIDGVKVQGSHNIPKSAIGEVTVLTGGIPANYGDVTGGVISIETRSTGHDNSRYSDQSYGRSRNNNKNTATYQPVEYVTPPNYDHFLPIYENDFLSPLTHPHSTFGIDVDQGAWTYLKHTLNNGRNVQRDAVKLEEMINAFQYRKIDVPKDELLHVEIERSSCAWNSNNELVTIHLQALDLPKDLPRKSHNFVFLIDVSGSMFPQDRLPLLIKGLKHFVTTLDENDRISIVTYAGNSGLVLPSTKCNKQQVILNALDNLTAGGSTNGIGGIKEAYQIAEENFDPELNNRIILATDGDFNVGINNPTELRDFISTKRGQGIYLTALGFGMGNYKNSTLESLAKSGDGNHFYIRNIEDMKKVLVNDIGNLMNIARDVKLNVEFNPKLVSNYRLIGYESRLLKPKDFVDDTKDAGEIGYGHHVTAVYEIEHGKAEDVESHFVKTKSSFFDNDIAFVKLRYKPMEESQSIEREYHLNKKHAQTENQLLNLVIAFGLELRKSVFKSELNLSVLRKMAMNFKATTEEEVELKGLILKYTVAGD